MSKVFQDYLQRQYRKHGALSPHDRLRVVEQLLERARQGVFPVSETAVGRVDPHHPGVQALLSATHDQETGRHRLGEGRRLPLLRSDEMAQWPTWKKVAFLAAVALSILGLTFGLVLVRRGFRKRAVAVAVTLTVGATSVVATPLTPVPTNTPTALSAPPPAPTPTLAPVQVQMGGSLNGPPPVRPTPQPGTPADDPAAPVAVEIEGYPQPIPVYLAEVGKDGRWVLPANGAEWLPQAYIRKVFAVGPDIANGLVFRRGGQVRIRTRGGYIETYVLTQRRQVPATQIEVMYGQRPSVALILARDGDTREVWVAEMPEVLAYAWGGSGPAVAGQGAPSGPTKAIVVVEGARLRAAPSTQARVVRRLTSGTVLHIDPKTGEVPRGRYTWYRVTAPYEGWIAHVVIQFLP